MWGAHAGDGRRGRRAAEQARAPAMAVAVRHFGREAMARERATSTVHKDCMHARMYGCTTAKQEQRTSSSGTAPSHSQLQPHSAASPRQLRHARRRLPLPDLFQHHVGQCLLVVGVGPWRHEGCQCCLVLRRHLDFLIKLVGVI